MLVQLALSYPLKLGWSSEEPDIKKMAGTHGPGLTSADSRMKCNT
jgi:hypothetical protein